MRLLTYLLFVIFLFSQKSFASKITYEEILDNPSDLIIDASTPSPDVPLIKPKAVYSLLIFIFIYSYFSIIVGLTYKIL